MTPKPLRVKCRIVARFTVRLALIHRQSKEELNLSVSGAGEPPCLYLRWPLAGERILNLLANRLEFAPQWHAADIDIAWHIWNLIVAPDRRERGNFAREGIAKVDRAMKGKVKQ